MAVEKKTAGLPLRVAAMDCAFKVLRSFTVACAVVAGIAWLVEHFELVRQAWAGALWIASFGGSFWGAVFVGVAAMAIAVWGMCMDAKVENFSGKTTAIGGVACFVMWFLAFQAGMDLTPDAFHGISAYTAGGVLVLCAPLAALALVLLYAGLSPGA